MNLKEIRSHIQSDKAFGEYLSGLDGDDGAVLDLVIQTVEVDGEEITDGECLELIAEIIYMYQHHKENN